LASSPDKSKSKKERVLAFYMKKEEKGSQEKKKKKKKTFSLPRLRKGNQGIRSFYNN
jgi:hypothetical protein